MHEEIFHISKKQLFNRNKKQQNKNIVAVGTTVTRALETGRKEGTKNRYQQSELFISPGYKFKCIDRNDNKLSFTKIKVTRIGIYFSWGGPDA